MNRLFIYTYVYNKLDAANFQFYGKLLHGMTNNDEFVMLQFIRIFITTTFYILLSFLFLAKQYSCLYVYKYYSLLILYFLLNKVRMTCINLKIC